MLVTPFPLAELRWKVTAILRRAGARGGTVHLGDLLVDEPAHLVERNGELVDLTALEFSLLVAFCRNRGHVLSKSQLLTMVWGFDHHDVEPRRGARVGPAPQARAGRGRGSSTRCGASATSSARSAPAAVPMAARPISWAHGDLGPSTA